MIFIISVIVTTRCGLLLGNLGMRVCGIWVWSFGVYWSEGLPLSWCLHIQGLRFFGAWSYEQVTVNTVKDFLQGRSGVYGLIGLVLV